MKLTLSLVLAALIGLCFTPAWAQDDAADQSAGLQQQVIWVSPFDFIRYRENAYDGDWYYLNQMELVDAYGDKTGSFAAQFHLPDGARIQRALWYIYDECNEEAPGVEGNIYGEIIRVQPTCDDVSKDKICDATSQGYPGYDCVDCVFTDRPPGINLANNNKFYYAAFVYFNQNDAEGCRKDESLRFNGLKIWYNLRVSPEPASPTFSDVPKGYWAYQYIEALASSGITDGCGGGNYCPENYVTRAQMAKFLAKGWGLYFAP